MSYTDFDFPHSDFYRTDLRQLIYKVEELWKEVHQIEGWEEEHKEQYDELKAFMDAIVSGNFPEGFEKTLTDWLEANAFDIIGKMVKHVYFGLTDDGHFMVTIPQQWRELIFSTTGYDITVPLMPEYGHLIISY